MKRRLRKLFLSMYWRYILAYSTIVIVIITLMGAYLYKYYFNTIYDDFVVSNKDYLSVAASLHENGLSHIHNISVQIGISDDITPFKLQEQPVKSIALKDQLKIYQFMSQFYHQIFLIFEVDDYLYNGTTSVHIDRFLHDGIVLGKDTSHTLYSLLKAPKTPSVLKEQEISGVLSSQGSAVLYGMPLGANKKGSLLFIVGSSYFNTLLPYTLGELRSSYILKDGSVIVSRGELAFKDSFIEDSLAGRSDGHFEVEDKDSKYLFILTNGDMGFQYCTVQSMKIFQSKIMSGQWGLLLFIMILAIPAAITIVIISRGLQRPINTIRSMFLRESTGNDMEVIQKGIRELSEQNQELNEIVESSLSIRRSEIVRNFVKGNYQSREAFIEAGRKVNLSLDRKYFAVILTGTSQQMNEKPVLENLVKMFSPEEEITGYGCELLPNNQTLFVFCADSKAAISDFALRFADAGRKLSDNFVMAISETHNDYSLVSSTYLEANTAYDNRFIMGEGDLLRFEDITVAAESEQFPQMYIEALKNALRVGDMASMHSVIDEIFRYLRSTKQSLFAFRVLYNDIISVLIKEWKPHHMEGHLLYNVFTLSQCLSIQDLDNMLRSICESLLDNKKNALEDTPNIMQKAAEYMRENYSDGELNMNALAEYLAVSTAALSVEFKEYTGMSPSDYLTLLRIERAKELLRGSNLSIKEICSAVGYHDIPGFNRRFKRYTAQTPLQFRQTYTEKIEKEGHT